MNETPDMSSELKQRIEKSILDAEVDVVLGSARHYEISVVSASFEGLSLVKRQQQVYAAITDLMGVITRRFMLLTDYEPVVLDTRH